SAPGFRAHEVGVQVPASGSVRLDFDLTPERQAKALLRGRVTGTEGEPLADAVVEVMHTYWRTQSRPNGAFEIPVPPGTWRLRISKIGYRPDTLSTTTGEAVSGAIQARLEPLVLELRGISVQAARTPALGQTVTSSTVRQVPPLGEPDIFRAVVLLPGVSQPNDLKGRIHLAGGSSDETGIRLDGHPLQDPFHLLGLFGAFNVAALERADVLIHHLPARIGGRLSGVVDLETRRPAAEPEREVVTSLLTSGLTVSQPLNLGGMDLLAAGRVTYLDRVAPLFVPDVPRLGFTDALLRVGRSWGSGWRAEALGFTTRDRFRESRFAGATGYRPLTWGESLAGLRLTRSGGPWEISARTSFNRAGVHLDERPAGGSNLIESTRDWWSSAVEVTRGAEDWRLSAGASLDRRRNQQAWIARGLADEIFSPNTPQEFAHEEAQLATALFGELSGTLAERWTATAGARVWHAAGSAYLAPRAVVSVRAGDAFRVEAALDRRYQFDAQLEEPMEGSITAPLFLLEEPRSADVGAVSVDWNPTWLPFGGTASARVQAFAKRYPDRTRLREAGSPDGAASRFPEFERIPGESLGAMLGGQLAWGTAGIVQGSYTYQRVREEFEGELSPTSWDAPHTLALFTSLPLWRKWVLNAVYHAHSGRATTPVLARSFGPYTGVENRFLRPRYLLGERNSIRVPPYHRLDLGARRSWEARGAEWTLALQVLNVLFRENAIDYDWSVYFSDLRGRSGPPRAGRNGLPILPSIGLEVRW
ncbi:MAG: TonB-dependent receptor, partial [Gemmatimonadota bacterium]|nr:TonB-dependent receptor [Gemmatimonadota bacterium]